MKYRTQRLVDFLISLAGALVLSQLLIWYSNLQTESRAVISIVYLMGVWVLLSIERVEDKLHEKRRGLK